jgi:hypothetical protein
MAYISILPLHGREMSDINSTRGTDYSRAQIAAKPRISTKDEIEVGKKRGRLFNLSIAQPT